MQVLMDGQKRGMAGARGGFVPPRRRFGDLWLAVVDALVRILTLGRGRVVKTRSEPIHWAGAIR